MIKLLKPICFFDLETTGIDRATTRIVEISICKLYPNGSKDIKTRLINPEIPIPIEASEVHGIYNANVADKPTFKQVAKGLNEFIGDSDIGGYNSNKFDIPVLVNEFYRAGIIFEYSNRNLLDVQNIFKRKEQRTLGAAVKFYLGRELVGAHGAEADILATIDVLNAQLNRYEDLPQTMKELALYSNYDQPIIDVEGKFTVDKDGDAVFNFGKWKDHKARTQPNFVEWMLRGDFTEDVKAVCRKILDGKLR
jgi:DNA polymerase-3 subunit epsilon